MSKIILEELIREKIDHTKAIRLINFLDDNELMDDLYSIIESQLEERIEEEILIMAERVDITMIV